MPGIGIMISVCIQQKAAGGGSPPSGTYIVDHDDSYIDTGDGSVLEID